MAKIQPIILAGGCGSRLWPISREAYPKQLLELTGHSTLLQSTAQRLDGLPECSSPIVVVGEKHKEAAKRQLDALIGEGGYEILVEPLGLSTGPAICGAVEYCCLQHGEDGVLAVLPSDHLIGNVEGFYQAVREGEALAAEGHLVTIGVAPRSADTGYGYIEADSGGRVIRFKEKPDKAEAQLYLEKDHCFWNSGILLFTPATFRQEMNRYAPAMQDRMAAAVKHGLADGDFFRFDAHTMTGVDDSSIDHALMEKTGVARVVPAGLEWLDIGSYQALWQIHSSGPDGNVHWGDVVNWKSRNSLVLAEKRLVATVGLENVVVVETGDAVLVADMSSAQDVRKVVEQMREQHRPELRQHRTRIRPWGTAEILEVRERCQINRVIVNPAAGLSLQKHYHRSEHWVVVSGTARVTSGKDIFLLKENESTFIPAGVVHRLENPGAIPLKIIEVQIGSYIGDDDIIAYKEAYSNNEVKL